MYLSADANNGNWQFTTIDAAESLSADYSFSLAITAEGTFCSVNGGPQSFFDSRISTCDELDYQNAPVVVCKKELKDSPP